MRNKHFTGRISDCKLRISDFRSQIPGGKLQHLVAVLALCLVGSASLAAEAPAIERALREIYVPFSDLHVLLEQQPKRVLLRREEYDDLVKKAKQAPETHAPRPAAIIAAEYTVTAGQQRAEIQGTLTVDVLEDGLHALPLDLGGVGLQDAKLDHRNASIGRSDGGRLMLFVEGVGRHELVLAMVAPLETTAARQVLNFRLPRPAAARLRLTAPGDVEVKGGADVVSRTLDVAAKVTRFELLPREGDTSLLLTLNSHLQQQQRAVVARSVLVDEVTQAYEKLHATVSLGILYRAIDQLRFVVPEGFEIAEVSSPFLARWEVQQEGGRTLLHVQLREQTTETVVLNILAIRAPGQLVGWHAPRLEPLDVVGSVALLGLLVEDRLKAESLATTGLIPIDTSVLSQALPAIVLEGGPGSPALRAVAAWYAPQSEFTLTAHYPKPPAEMAVTTSLLLLLADKGQEVLGGLSLLPRVEKRFSFDVSVPAGWHVASVTAAGGQPLTFERYTTAEGGAEAVSPRPKGEKQGVKASRAAPQHAGDALPNSPHPNPLPKGEGTIVHPNPLPKGEGTIVQAKEAGTIADAAGRVRVTVPAGIPVGNEFKVNFRAVRTPPGWLAPWPSSSVEFPAFAVMGASRDEGAIAVDVRDDMTVRPEKLAQLTPLDAAEKPKYGLADVATTLAYRYESPKYTASLVVERTRPRLTARTFSFLRVAPDALNCHFELIYNVEEARTQRLALVLPKSTPASVAITAIDGVKLKEFSSEILGAKRRWNVLLAEAQRDRIRLAVDFQQPLPSQEPKGFSLPIVAAEGVIYQSGLMAVEGCAELEVRVDTASRRVDVGELADADYQPGRRLLGAFGFAGDPPVLKIDVLRHPGYGIYPAIVEECSLDTNLSPEGQSQTQARFKLRTKAVYLQVKLPAGAELWSAELDGMPLKPQRQGDNILIDVPASTANAAQTLQIVYAAPVSAVALRGTVDVPAPKLRVRAERGPDGVEVPLADLLWRLHLPSGYEVVWTGGTVVAADLARPLPAAVEAAGILYHLSGGISGPPLLLPAVYSAREAGRRRSPFAAVPLIEALSGPADELSERVEALPKAAEKPAEKSAMSAREPKAGQRFARALGEGDKTSVAAKTGGEIALREVGKERELASRRRDTLAAYQGLAGIRSLKIDVVQSPSQTDRVLTFRSLGVEPLLVVTLTNQSRLSALAWGLALAVGLIGAAMTRKTVRKKTAFILTVAIVATFVPLATNSIELAQVCNRVFYAACLLVPYYLLAGLVRRLFGPACRMCQWCAAKLARTPAAPAIILLVLFMGANAGATLQAAAAEASLPPAAGPYVIQVVEPPTPVNVPPDAIILPYDPDSKTGIKDVDKLLVPYEKYVDLWNRVHPDKKIETKAPPGPYALAGATYKTLLEGDEYLLLAGQMEIDVFADGFVQVPLGLGGGVLAQAELDGKPARLSVAAAKPAGPKAAKDSFAQQVAPQQAERQAADRSLVILYVSGKGRHKLELAVRLKLSRQGGWRVAEGVLPVAPATRLAISVPKAQTELRLGQVSDRRRYDTEKPDEAINTALNADGAVSIQWRPKVAEGQVDHSLTATSRVVFDVQEDGLRLLWQLDLEFRRSQRERFGVALPAGFLLEKVEGNNVRGWEIRQTEKGHSVEIALLQAAKDHERFTLRLWQAGSVGREKLAQFDVPEVSVPDAALHNGQLTIRRSPLLEVRTLDRSGVTRTDLPGDVARSDGGVGGEESPLGIRPFEAYSFAAVPFTVRLAAAPVAARIAATVQTVLRIADYERSLESRIAFDVQGHPVYQLQMFLPEDLRVDHVSAPGEFQYAVTQQDKRPLLTIYLATGQQGNVPVLIRGRLGREGELKELLLPRLEVRNVDRQQGEVAVQVDPAFDVDATGLKHCEKVLLSRVYAWLNPEQRRVARLGLHYTQGDYAGTLRLALRKADVVCDTISNVRVTDRALEETILLDFTIKNAGLRELSFLLPQGMAGSRISVPMLRQKTVEAVSKEAGAPLRVRVELQDEVMDQLRILVENDRLLTPGSHEVPIPMVELGRTNRRYVALESAGRDPLKVEDEKLRELDALGRQQREWEMLKGVLGREMTLAYLVAPDARQPRLSFHTETHAAVETVGARIGLAETTLALDANGAYRAQQVLRLDNTTEQFLEIRLPEGAALWTARVAGEPVKPTRLPVATDLRRVRIPLIKTAPGDLSYDVVLKYGGQMPALGTLGNVTFPLVHCENIRPDLSQVRLYVPEKYRWFDFGGTMRLVTEEVDLQAGYLKFQTKQTEQIMATLQQGDKWAKIRAATNLKIQQGLMSRYRSSLASQSASSELQSELNLNANVAKQANQEATKLELTPERAETQDNRLQLNRRFQGQKSSRARNVVNDLGANWSEAVEMKSGDISHCNEPFSREWLGKNKLDRPGNARQQMKRIAGPSPSSLAKPMYDDKGKNAAADVPRQPSAAQVVQSESQQRPIREAPLGTSAGRGVQTFGREYAAQPGRQPADVNQNRQARQRKDSDDAIGRYKERLERQGAQQKEMYYGFSSPTAGRSTRPNAPPAAETMTGRLALGVGINSDAGLVGGPATAPPVSAALSGIAADGRAPAVQPPATGLASLDFELPTRGALYRFTTPRGEVEITAWSFSNDLLRRLVAMAIVAVVALVIGTAARRMDRGRFAWLETRTGSTLLICLGLLSFFGGILPVVGLVAVVAGCGLLVHRRVCGGQAC